MLTLAAMLVMAGAASAQVAAPLLNPTPILSPSPSNPATASWDMPSRVAAAASRTEFDAPAVASPFAKGGSVGALAEYVGDRFAFVAAGQRLKVDAEPSVGSGSNTQTSSIVAASVQFDQTYSVALGQEHLRTENTIPPAGTIDETTPLLGATVRLGNALYLGMAGGTAKFAPGGGPQVDRGVLRYGIAYAWRDKTGGLHAEVYADQRKAGTNGPSVANGQNATGGTLEVRAGSLFAGYEGRTSKKEDPSGASTGKDVFTTISVGWVQDPGWGMVLSSNTIDVKDASGVTVLKAKQLSLGVSWMF